jgi:MFS family permease
VRDRRIIYVIAFLRAVTTGLVGVVLGVYLARLGVSGTAFGGIIAAGLAGVAVAGVAATFFADRLGRRRFLVSISLISAVGTVAFVLVGNPVALGVAAFFGMLNGMGRDRGAAQILEQAALPATTTEQDRTRVIAWYTMLQDLGHALGSLLAGIAPWVARSESSDPAPHRMMLLGCAAMGIAAAALYAGLGRATEVQAPAGARGELSSKTRGILARISALFAIDGLAGGFLTTAMLSYFFVERFGASEALVGSLFFGARLLNAGSHLAAAWLAKRIGLVNTMVFTHIPSSILLVTVAFAPSFPVAAVLFLLREELVEMDVPTRQSYVLAVVAPEERTLASGTTNIVRLAAWAVAPTIAGALMIGESMTIPLVVGAGMKISYDILLWLAFRRLPPPEETPPNVAATFSASTPS